MVIYPGELIVTIPARILRRMLQQPICWVLLVVCIVAFPQVAKAQGGGGEDVPRFLKRPSNPDVRRKPKPKVVTRSASNRRTASVDPKADVTDQIEDAIERGNSERDAKNYTQAEEQ